jgi:mannan endo-1,6-alpha-mannosidase
MMEYWHYTGDTSYNVVMYEALVSQLGPGNDFVVPNEAFNEGNDDQAFWVFAAMSAAEHGFPPPPEQFPPWVTTVVNAWELFVQRWNHDSVTCGGGLKWQFYEANAGYHYKYVPITTPNRSLHPYAPPIKPRGS